MPKVVICDVLKGEACAVRLCQEGPRPLRCFAHNLRREPDFLRREPDSLFGIAITH
jgi:hypothetical protein